VDAAGLEDRLMRVLVVVHGFPPAVQTGSEIYAHAHAVALRRRFGDEVFVLTREADASRDEHTVRIEKRDGLTIASINNTFRRARSFEESYRNDAIAAVAAATIDDFRPDVAHIHHLTCLSTTIVRALNERGIPSVMTLHDYWLICHRGQLLDVDYQLCDGPEPDGCHNCLGPAAGAGRVTLTVAAAARAVVRRPFPAFVPIGSEGATATLAEARKARRRQGRRSESGRLALRLAQRVAPLASDPRIADDQARRRLEHMRDVCADITHFVAPSRCMADRFVRFGVKPERITVAPYGFDRAPFGGIVRTASDRLRLGFLGSVMASKAPHILLEAVGRLPRGSASVDLFGGYLAYHGDDGYRERIDRLAVQSGARVHGAIPHDRVAQALASIDVLVVPSIWPENSPLVIAEAFMAGVPVVASRIGGIPEIVADGRNGLLFRPGDAADLARALDRLRREPGLLDRLREGAATTRVRSIDDDVEQTRALHAAARGRAAPDARTAAVVLNYRAPVDTLLAVKSLLASRRPLSDIIVVDNDPSDDAPKALADVASRITYLKTGRNLGFSGGMNVGIREALGRGAQRVLLVNSDVIVPPDCVDRLERCLGSTSSVGIAGPVVLWRSEPDWVASLGISYRPTSGRMRHRGFGTRIDAYALGAASVVDGVSGCLMLVKREVFDAIGLFDEDYFFSFEDLDFCLRARRGGFATVLAGQAAAHHEGGRSIGTRSPRRLYFAARGHLLLAKRAGPAAAGAAAGLRTLSIVMLNLAHGVLSPGASLPVRLAAVARGTRDYFAGRFGPDSSVD
jgi:GT2 family glycosyltransferase/glycosyltransferase involved in cell wall biosynthesis